MILNIKIIGKIPEKTIFFAKFSAKNVNVNKCTSSSGYFKDIEKFSSQFKKLKEITVTMEIICNLSKEKH